MDNRVETEKVEKNSTKTVDSYSILNGTIDCLNGIIKKQDKNIDHLKGTIDRLMGVIEKKDDKIDHLMSTVEENMDKMEYLSQKNLYLKNKLKALKDDNYLLALRGFADDCLMRDSNYESKIYRRSKYDV